MSEPITTGGVSGVSSIQSWMTGWFKSCSSLSFSSLSSSSLSSSTSTCVSQLSSRIPESARISGRPRDAIFLWKDAELTPTFVDSFERGTWITLIWCVIWFATLLPITILEAVTRRHVPDLDGDGYPGSSHFGLHVWWGAELQHVATAALMIYFCARAAECVRECCTPTTSLRFDTSRMPALGILVHGCFVVAHPTCITTSLIYFIFLRNNDNHTSSSTTAYAANLVIVILDILFTRLPFRFAHCIWSFMLGFAYVFFTICFYFTMTSSNQPYRYIYYALDWTQPLRTFGFILLVVGLHVVVCACFAWLSKLLSVYFRYHLLIPVVGQGIQGDDVDVAEDVAEDDNDDIEKQPSETSDDDDDDSKDDEEEEAEDNDDDQDSQLDLEQQQQQQQQQPFTTTTS